MTSRSGAFRAAYPPAERRSELGTLRHLGGSREAWCTVERLPLESQRRAVDVAWR